MSINLSSAAVVIGALRVEEPNKFSVHFLKHVGLIEPKWLHGTVQSLYNTPHYNTDLDITWSCCGSQIIFTMEFY